MKNQIPKHLDTDQESSKVAVDTEALKEFKKLKMVLLETKRKRNETEIVD